MPFIKIYDTKLADTLIAGGFSYVTETINDNQIVYAFVKTEDLMTALSMLSKEKFMEVSYLESNLVSF